MLVRFDVLVIQTIPFELVAAMLFFAINAVSAWAGFFQVLGIPGPA